MKEVFPNIFFNNFIKSILTNFDNDCQKTVVRS